MNLVQIALQFKPSLFKRSFLIALISFILCHVNHLQGQSLSIFAGPSVPFGDYGSKNIFRLESGFAKPGFQVSMLLEDQRKARVLNTYFQFSYNKNTWDEVVFSNYFKNTDPLFQSVNSLNAWSQYLFIPGLKANLFKQGYDFYAKAGLGFGVFNSFAQTRFYDSSMYVLSRPSTANGLVINAGMGLNVHLNATIDLCAGMEMQYAKLNYGKVIYTDGANNKIGTSTLDLAVPFQVIQWHLGLRFKLGKK